jgi:protein-S-isoprenylcysteine O-methyltransferase Ste14
MSRLSFKEKMLWVQLAGVVIVGGYYIHVLTRTHGHHYFHAIILILLLLFGLVRLLAKRRSGNVVQDERDGAISCQGARWSNNVLWLGLLLILVAYWDDGSLRSADFIIGLIFHLLLLAALVRIVRELVAYRMSA